MNNNDPYNVNAEVIVYRVNSDNLQLIDSVYIDFGPESLGPTSGIGVSNLIADPHGGYFGWGIVGDPVTYIDKWFWFKLNDDLTVDWYRYGDWQTYQPVGLLINSALNMPDGGYTLGGYRQEGPSDPYVQYIIKMDACGYLEPSDCPEIISVQDDVYESSLKLWPNPTSGVCHVQFPKPVQYFILRDLTGREVYRKYVYSTSSEIDISHLAKGTYFLSTNEVELGVEKLIDN
jgi:hypothetical protein